MKQSHILSPNATLLSMSSSNIDSTSDSHDEANPTKMANLLLKYLSEEKENIDP